MLGEKPSQQPKQSPESKKLDEYQKRVAKVKEQMEILKGDIEANSKTIKEMKGEGQQTELAQENTTEQSATDAATDKLNDEAAKRANNTQENTTEQSATDAATDKLNDEAAKRANNTQENTTEEAIGSKTDEENPEIRKEYEEDDTATVNLWNKQNEELTQRKEEAKSPEELTAENKGQMGGGVEARGELHPQSEEGIATKLEPTSSVAPPSFKGDINDRPDVVNARTEREKAEAERIAAINKEVAERISEKYGKQLKEALSKGDKDAILRIEQELDAYGKGKTGFEKRREIISVKVQAIHSLSKAELSQLVEMADRRFSGKSLRRIAKKRLRLLTKGGPYPQENLKERVYPSTQALKNAIENRNVDQVRKIEEGLDRHEGLRGGGEITRNAEVAQRTQKVVNELSREELQWLVANTKSEGKNKERSLHYIAQRRLDTLPKAA